MKHFFLTQLTKFRVPELVLDQVDRDAKTKKMCTLSPFIHRPACSVLTFNKLYPALTRFRPPCGPSSSCTYRGPRRARRGRLHQQGCRHRPLLRPARTSDKSADPFSSTLAPGHAHRGQRLRGHLPHRLLLLLLLHVPRRRGEPCCPICLSEAATGICGGNHLQASQGSDHRTRAPSRAGRR